MKQIIQSARSGKLSLQEVPGPPPQPRPGHLMVRTSASLISAGTERMVIGFARKSLAAKAKARPDLVRKVMEKARRDGIAATLRAVMARLDEPLPLGYSAAGTVELVGAGLEGRFRVGQRVAVAGAGLANHAEMNAVPGNLAALVPDDVSDEEACFGTLAAIALHGVRNLGLGLGDYVAVIGAGLVGQLATQFLALAGTRVVAIDYDTRRLELARSGGAELCWNLADGDPAGAIANLTEGIGCDGVVIAAATDSSEPFMTAASVARDRARISLVGMTGTELPFREFMQKELSVVVSRSYGPGRYDADYEDRGLKYPDGYVRWTETRNLAEAVRLMSRRSDRLSVEQLITHRFPIDLAEEAYGLVIGASEPHLGVVLRYPDQPERKRPGLSVPPVVSASRSPGECVLGVIGSGAFARTILLPHLKSVPNCRLHTIITQRGLSAEHSRLKFGFRNADTDVDAVLMNPDINAVLVATPHSSHAYLTVRALEAGKSVLVEKPLALSREELDSIVKARAQSTGFFQVGFNRRFAPHAETARAQIRKSGGKAFVLVRVNAGAIPPDSRQNTSEEGGGRILGELCHFVDLIRYLVGARIVSVTATAAAVERGVCEDLTVTINLSDGSLGTIAYTARGDTASSKELVECYVGGTVITIDDFRRLTTVIDGKPSRSRRTGAQDKGHAGELNAFVAAIANGGPPPVPEAELVESSLTTIAVLESLRSGSTVNL